MKKIFSVMTVGLSSIALMACSTSTSETEAAVTVEETALSAESSVTTESASESETVETVEAEEVTEEESMGDREMGGGPNAGGGRGFGSMPVNNPEHIQEIIDANYEKFQQFSFTDEETGITLDYNLYIPENYDESESYPLVLYMTDSTGTGKSAIEIVQQYYGANVWVTDEEQEKHPSFVLVPAFIETVVSDDWSHSEQIEVVLRIIESLEEEYSIDENRLYTTGQSSGGMTSFYINATYPDIFAASLYAASQWDINVLKGLETQNFFYIVAGGDTKASAGQDEVLAMFDADNAEYSYGEWSAQDDAETQNAAAKALIDQNRNANMIRFTVGTVLDGTYDMEHMASFNYCYDIESVRDWLFAQSK